jgi:PLP dependent protein
MSTAIAAALEQVRQRVGDAAERAGRDIDEVRVIAVSKTKSASAVREAYEAGQRDFGENYVQELCAKAEELADLKDVRWHMIGHLQTNKVKQVLKVVWMVQTVDSARLAVELGKRAQQAGCTLAVLIEVNVGGEQQKSGVSVEQVRTVVQAVRAQESLQLRGLMTVPPFELDASETAPYFAKLRQLRDDLGQAQERWELSMGMSNDFEEAIAHGATMVRVGTQIFGSR